MSNEKRKAILKRIIVTFSTACILTLCLIYCNYQYGKDFIYTFTNVQVKFPLTVEQAIRTYKVLPHKYNRTGVPYDSPCPPNVPVNGISEIFYVDRVDDYFKPPTDSLSRNIYALKFCFTKQDRSAFYKMKNQIEKDFDEQFDLKYNDDTNEYYYQMDASHNVKVIIEFYPEFAYITDQTKAQKYQSWAVSFCYNLFGYSIHHYTKYERNYDAQ